MDFSGLEKRANSLKRGIHEADPESELINLPDSSPRKQTKFLAYPEEPGYPLIKIYKNSFGNEGTHNNNDDMFGNGGAEGIFDYGEDPEDEPAHQDEIFDEIHVIEKEALPIPQFKSRRSVEESAESLDPKKKEKAGQVLEFMKKISQDPTSIEANEDFSQNLDHIANYKAKKFKIVFPDEIFTGSDIGCMTPHIFYKKNQLVKSKINSPQLAAFENYLYLVSQMYYNKNMSLNEYLHSLEVCKEKENQTLAPEEDKTALGIKKTVIAFVKGEGQAATSGRGGKKKRGRGSHHYWTLQREKQNLEVALSKVEHQEHLELQIVNAKVDILSTLISPLRSELTFEKWCPLEIAIFETGICKYGKQYLFLHHLIKSKSMTEVIEFYQMWKMSSHYKIWKCQKGLLNKMNYNTWL